jgi:predicted dienelactone hydrolase
VLHILGIRHRKLIPILDVHGRYLLPNAEIARSHEGLMMWYMTKLKTFVRSLYTTDLARWPTWKKTSLWRLPFCIVFFVLSLGLGTGCEVDSLEDTSTLPFEPAGTLAAPDPSIFGPFPVGVKTITLEDDSRTAPSGEGNRSIVTEIWYPSEAHEGDAEPVSYDLWEHLPPHLREDIPPDALGIVSTSAVQDVPLDASRGPYPVVLFSHGKGGIRMQSTFFTVALASHGFVVIAPDHQGDTIVELLEEGDIVVSTTVDSFIDRPLDLSFLISHLENLPNDDFFFGHVDLEQIGVAGHSFGALTAFRTAGFDARVRAIATHTPVGYGLVNAGLEVSPEDFGIPVMLEAAGMDETLPAEEHAGSLWNHLVSPRYYLTIHRAGHFTYSDLCILDVEAIDAALEIDASNVLADGCGEDNISSEEAFPVINHTTIGFFNRYLRDSPVSQGYLDEGYVHKLVGKSEASFLVDPN